MWLLNLDKNITFWFYRDFLPEQQQLLYYVASYFVYLLPLILLYLFFYSHKDRVNAVKILLITVFSWKVLSLLIGYWLYSQYGFRDRPFSDLGLNELLFERPEKAFPSDHAAVFFSATLSFFFLKYKKLGMLFLFGGVLASSLARVAIGFHWFGDILGGFAVGLLAFGLLVVINRPLGKLVEKVFSWGNGKKA